MLKIAPSISTEGCYKAEKYELKSDQQINNWILNYDHWITEVVTYRGAKKYTAEDLE